MEWIVVVAIGAAIGVGVSFFAAGSIKMPYSLTIFVAVVGAIFGGLIVQFSGFLAFGPFSFYIAATALSIALLAGAMLAHSLTNEEKRI